MDYTQVLQPLFNTLWYLIPLTILAAVIKSPWFKGKAGETVVNLSAKLFLDKTRYHLIKNVTLLTEDGTTQVDHIIVVGNGVLVEDLTFKTPMPGNVRYGGGYIRFLKPMKKSRLPKLKCRKLLRELT